MLWALLLSSWALFDMAEGVTVGDEAADLVEGRFSASAGILEPTSGYAVPAVGNHGDGFGASAPTDYSGYGSAFRTGYGPPGYGVNYNGGYYGGFGPSNYGDPLFEGLGNFSIEAIVVPILALVGLSLLFPTFTTVANRRKRRWAEPALRGEDGVFEQKLDAL